MNARRLGPDWTFWADVVAAGQPFAELRMAQLRWLANHIEQEPGCQPAPDSKHGNRPHWIAILTPMADTTRRMAEDLAALCDFTTPIEAHERGDDLLLNFPNGATAAAFTAPIGAAPGLVRAFPRLCTLYVENAPGVHVATRQAALTALVDGGRMLANGALTTRT